MATNFENGNKLRQWQQTQTMVTLRQWQQNQTMVTKLDNGNKLRQW